MITPGHSTGKLKRSSRVECEPTLKEMETFGRVKSPERELSRKK
jgi:hypothetical protein